MKLPEEDIGPWLALIFAFACLLSLFFRFLG